MIRRLLWAILYFAIGSAALAQNRYAVTLQFDADDDPQAVIRQLAAMYRLQVVDPAGIGASTVTVTTSEAAIDLLRNDRRIVAIEARPQLLGPHADGFGVYSYDGAGNITQVGDDTFDYDKQGRIKNATIANVKQTFTYDRWGNITKIATVGETDQTIAVSANNRLSGATYDGSGNLTSYHGGTFIYDALNVVKESTPIGGNRHLHLYSASNERIATIEPVGAQQQSEWTIRDDAGKVLRRLRKSLNDEWSWQEDYIYRGNLLLAAEVPSPEKVRHFHLDHLGTPRLITGNRGAVIARRSYGAFGRGLHTESTPAPDELAQFTGHERDSFQLDYMHARYYDPMLGRFLAVDPALDFKKTTRQPQSWNRYQYVENNPTNRVDPDGRCSAAVLFTVFFLCGTVDLYDYVSDRIPQVLEGVRSLTDDRAPSSERLMGAAVVGIIGAEVGLNFAGSGEGRAVEGAAVHGYRSFTAFKRAIGPAGEGMQWHHIVEQNQANTSTLDSALSTT